MSEPAAILATFSDLKLVKGRKCAQLIFEVPIEQASAAVNILGMPNPAKEIWCGIAVTNLRGAPNGNAGSEGRSSTHEPTNAPSPLKTHLAGGDANGGPSFSRASEAPPAKPNSTRAVMMAKDEEFQKYMRSIGYRLARDEQTTDAAIKEYCRVQSKTELNEGHGANNFELLRQAFRGWKYEEARR